MVGASLKANVFIEIWDKDLITPFHETLSASLPSGGLCSIYLSIYLAFYLAKNIAPHVQLYSAKRLNRRRP